MATLSLLSRLDARDRALFLRWASGATIGRRRRRAWTVLTHAGGASCTIAASTVPLALHGALREAAWLALITLVVSHLIVQLIKRTVGRPRPSRGTSCATLVTEPDRFSFPSGHAAAAMSVAFAYAVVFPHLSLPLVVSAALVGMSRVCLGVHYPGDVFVGQAIALGTGWAVVAIR
jgi:undecaprenyl-diphosphatase